MTKTKGILIFVLLALFTLTLAQISVSAGLNARAGVLTPYDGDEGLALSVNSDGDDLVLNVAYDEGSYEYQYWIKQKVQTDEDNEVTGQYIWQLLPSGGYGESGDTYTIEDIAGKSQYIGEDGRINVVVRVREENGAFIGEAHGAYTLDDAGIPVITSVTVKGRVVSDDYIVVNKSEALNIQVIGNLGTELNYSVLLGGKSAGVANNTGTFNGFDLTENVISSGLNKITVQAQKTGGSTVQKEISIYVIDEYVAAQRPVITALEGIQDGETEGLFHFIMKVRYADGLPLTKEAAQSLNYKLTGSAAEGVPELDGGNLVLDAENNVNILFDVQFGGYGIYQIIGEVARQTINAYDDKIIVWFYDYARTAAALEQNVSEGADWEDGVYKGNTVTPITITASGSIGEAAVQYAFYREDASGWVLVRDYPRDGSAGDTFTWNPQRSGTYNIQVRMRDKNNIAGAFEKAVNRTYIIADAESVDLDKDLLNIEVIDYQTNLPIDLETDSLIAGNLYKIKAVYSDAGNADNVLYRFTLTSANLGTVYLNRFNTSPYYLFIPGKEDNYTVTARVIHMSSFGYKDISVAIPISSVVPGIKIDGIIDEEEWAERTYTTMNTPNNVIQTTHTYIGASGIYLGLSVSDPNIIIPSSSHIELYMTVNDDLSLGSGWQLRFYPDGTFKTYLYSGTTTWTEKTDADKLQISCIVAAQSDRYDVEAYLPYSVLGLSEKPEIINMIPAMYFTPLGGSAMLRDGDINRSLAQMLDLENYVRLDKDGLIITALVADNISLSDADLATGYFEKEFSIYTSSTKLNKVSGVIFNDTNITETAYGTYLLRIPSAQISGYMPSKTIGMTFGTLNISFTAAYTEMALDCVFDEANWGERTYTTKNTTHNVMQTTHTYIGEYGVYFGFSVLDPNIVATTSQVRLYIAVDDNLSANHGWSFRLYANGTFKTYIYNGGTSWLEKTGAQKLDIKWVINLQSDRYDIEAYLPYSVLGITQPEILNIIPMIFINHVGGGSQIYDGETSAPTYYNNISDYVRLDGDGLIVAALVADDITLSDADLTEGYYKKEFSVYTSSTRLNKVSGVEFDDPYITEIGNGTYLLSIPESEITGYTAPHTVTANFGIAITTAFQLSYTG